MRLVIGGAFQGKTDYVKAKYQIEDAWICRGGYPLLGQDCPAQTGSGCAAGSDNSGGGGKCIIGSRWKCISGLHNIIRRMMYRDPMSDPCGEAAQPAGDAQQEIIRAQERQPGSAQPENALRYIRSLIRDNPDVILICDEVGGGIVPVDKEERDYRECVGRVLCELAKEAESVERVYCGIGQTIKRTVRAAFIRHGATRGNLESRYVGTTDEPLCDEGRAAIERGRQRGIYPDVRQVIVSPMTRCLQTASLIYPGIGPQTESRFRETDFGLFEYKNHEELMADGSLRNPYQAWIDSGGQLPFPEGESRTEASARSCEAFEQLLPSLTEDTAFIVHGGTVMSILSQYAEPHKEYYAYRCDPGGGYLCKLEITGDGRLYRMTVEQELAAEHITV